jgi:hypothetical protein
VRISCKRLLYIHYSTIGFYVHLLGSYLTLASTFIKAGNDRVRLVVTRQAIKRTQAMVRHYVAADRSLSEELLRERREGSTNG